MKAEGFTKETILSKDAIRRDFPPFKPGDAIRVAERIKEGNKERIQYFEGDVVAIHNNGVASTFTVRRIAANGIGVEKIFPYYSPKLEGVEFLREGDVRRAKLYYMRDRIGKKARVKEKIRTHEQKIKLEQRLSAGTVAEDTTVAADVVEAAPEKPEVGDVPVEQEPKKTSKAAAQDVSVEQETKKPSDADVEQEAQEPETKEDDK